DRLHGRKHPATTHLAPCENRAGRGAPPVHSLLDRCTVRTLLLVFGLLPLVGPSLAEAASRPETTYVCQGAKQRRGSGARESATAVAVADRLGAQRVELGRPAGLCPAPPGAGHPLPAALPCLRPGPPAPARAGAGEPVEPVPGFGRPGLRVDTLDAFCVPSWIRSGAGGAAPDTPPSGASRACYGVHGPRPKGPRPRVAVRDASGERLLAVGRPTRLCTPADGSTEADLVCFATRLARTRPLRQPPVTRATMSVGNVYGSGVLSLGGARELCVAVVGTLANPPSTTSTTSTSTTTSTTAPPTTTPTTASTTTTASTPTSTSTTAPEPPATSTTSTTSTTLPSAGSPVAIRVVPAVLTVVAGERPQFTA